MGNVKTTTAVNELKVVNAKGAKVVIEPKVETEMITINYQIKQKHGKYFLTDTDEITGTFTLTREMKLMKMLFNILIVMFTISVAILLYGGFIKTNINILICSEIYATSSIIGMAFINAKLRRANKHNKQYLHKRNRF